MGYRACNRVVRVQGRGLRGLKAFNRVSVLSPACTEGCKTLFSTLRVQENDIANTLNPKP